MLHDPAWLAGGGGPGDAPPRPLARRWRAEQAEEIFQPQAGKDHAAQRSGPRPGNEVFALRRRTGTGQCPVVVTGTALSTPGVFGFALSTGSPASNLGRDWPWRSGSPSTAVFPSKPRRRSTPVRAPLPVRLRRSLRLRAPSPSASSRFAAHVPGPPKHRVALRGGRRSRCSASHQRSGTPTACGRLRPDPGGGREVGHSLRRASGRFSDHHDDWSPGRRGLAFRMYFSFPPTSSGPRNTWNHVQAQGNDSEIPR